MRQSRKVHAIFSSSDLATNYSPQQLADLRTAINAKENVAYIPYEFNCAVRAVSLPSS